MLWDPKIHEYTHFTEFGGPMNITDPKKMPNTAENHNPTSHLICLEFANFEQHVDLLWMAGTGTLRQSLYVLDIYTQGLNFCTLLNAY